MNRPSPRTIAFVAVTSLASAAIASTILEGGCAFSTPAQTPEESVCKAVGGYVQGCGRGSACVTAFVNDCDKVTRTLSAAAFNDLFACAELVVCADSGDALVTACMQAQSRVPTTIQQKLASDYCDRCSPGNTSCSAAFFAGDSGVAIGPIPLFRVSDAIVSTVDSTCTSSLSADAGRAACEATFAACAAPIVTSQVYLPPPCGGAFGGDDAGGGG